jgi:hypothetical protein
MNSNKLSSARSAQTHVESERARARVNRFAPRPLGIWITSKEPQSTIHVFHWQSQIGPHNSISSRLKVLDRASIEYLAGGVNTRWWWPVPVVLSTRAPSRMLP